MLHIFFVSFSHFVNFVPVLLNFCHHWYWSCMMQDIAQIQQRYYTFLTHYQSSGSSQILSDSFRTCHNYAYLGTQSYRTMAGIFIIRHIKQVFVHSKPMKYTRIYTLLKKNFSKNCGV